MVSALVVKHVDLCVKGSRVRIPLWDIADFSDVSACGASYRRLGLLPLYEATLLLGIV